jgi:hypothetical protein
MQTPREIATHPETKPERLLNLYRHRDNSAESMEVVRAIARHPNLPPTLLYELMRAMPGVATDVIKNPALPLLLIEDPAFFSHAHPNTLLDILKKADIPEYVVQVLTHQRKKEVAQTAQLHIAVAGESGENWHQEMLTYLASLPTHSFERARILKEEPWEVRQELTHFTNLPVWFFSLWGGVPSKKRSIKTVFNIQANALTNPIGLMQGDAYVHFVLLAHPEQPQKSSITACSLEWELRLAAAIHHHAEETTILELAQDGNRLVRAAARERLDGVDVFDKLWKAIPNGNDETRA